ncbi:hypothetical protein C8F04DRAFT_1192344 [Mycena alexandri]|uniref:Uncharacterized protein n=1 Tax=Mycena alexandri TaxID=1745969 RepID=A0AAD6WV08_9AGAR|nr:hypothetical protein C8F04DRAFT_1192344 [Mycena alexandri]
MHVLRNRYPGTDAELFAALSSMKPRRRPAARFSHETNLKPVINHGTPYVVLQPGFNPSEVLKLPYDDSDIAGRSEVLNDIPEYEMSAVPAAAAPSGSVVPEEHPSLSLLRLQGAEIARLQGLLRNHDSNKQSSESELVVNAARKAQYSAMERLYKFKAKLWKQPRELSAESQEILTLSSQLENIFSEFFLEIYSSSARH